MRDSKDVNANNFALERCNYNRVTFDRAICDVSLNRYRLNRFIAAKREQQ